MISFGKIKITTLLFLGGGHITCEGEYIEKGKTTLDLVEDQNMTGAIVFGPTGVIGVCCQ